MKYKNVKVSIDGIRFDSKRESIRYAELKQMEARGDIRNLELQPVYKIVVNGEQVRFPGSNRPMKYIADFQYRTDDGRLIVEDVKGVKTDVYKIKKALVEHIYPGVKITEVS